MSNPKITAFVSHKGGTGKTTTNVATMKTLAGMGKKCLAIDFDSNLSLSQIFDSVGHSPNSIDLLNGDKINPMQTSVENIWIIPSDLRIFRMSSLPEKILKKSLMAQDLSMFDYVFLDPPGTLNAMTATVICAADKIIIPAMPSEIDFEATSLVIEEMEMMDVEADVSIVLNGWDSKRNLNGILEKFQTYEDLFYSKPIPAMKSLKNLTENVEKYKLVGVAKKRIEDFVLGVVL